MIKNNFKVSFRSLKHQKIFSFINIFGLTVGLTAVILIVLNIKFEYSFNSFNKKADRIYRVGTVFQREGKVIYNSPEFVAALGPAMLKEFPEVENFVRMSTPRSMEFINGDKSFMIDNISYADSDFLKIFSFRLIQGNLSNVLHNPYSVVLTQSTAGIIFGNGDAVGKFITIEGKPYLITGVAEDPPANSDIQFSGLVSFSTLSYRTNSEHFLGWYGGNQFITYLELKKNASPNNINKSFSAFLLLKFSELAKMNIKFYAHLEPLEDIHMHYNDNSPALRRNLNTFSIIALFILLIACANFINLSTARASGKAKEVGMRKVLGANKRSLIFQFLSESFLLALLAFILSLMLVEILLPWYGNLIGKQLAFSKLLDLKLALLLLSVLLFTGIVAGFYPAVFLTSYQPANTLKGNLTKSVGKLLLRKSLVILQFSISTILIISTFIINSQISFMREKDLGINEKKILVLSLDNNVLKEKYETLKNELKTIPGILNASASTEIPGYGFTSNGYFPEGYKTPLMIHVVESDNDFLSTYGIKLTKGRNFNDEIKSDRQAYIINRKLASLLNWNEPLGKLITRNGEAHPVIGEIKDFNYAPLYYPIQPLIITNRPEAGKFNFISIELGSGNITLVMNSVQKVWSEFAPMLPFNYFFLNSRFDNIYRTEFRFREAFFIFSGLAIFVALLGLLGLVSFSVELRRKEIGIRKVLGSSVSSLIIMLTKEYSKWVLIANIVAWPAAFYLMNKWLQDFAYRTEVQIWVFILAGIIVLVSALLIVGFQVVRASSVNPVKSLRYE